MVLLCWVLRAFLTLIQSEGLDKLIDSNERSINFYSE